MYFYVRETGGAYTNLQLYALRQAKKYWYELQEEYEISGEITDDLTERCVFVLATLGLSISQLLGQNNPEIRAKVPSPVEIFTIFAEKYNLDKSLIDDFIEFNDSYNGCRHFGKTTGPKGYQRVENLTYERTKELYGIGKIIWEAIVNVFKKDSDNRLEFFDIDDIEPYDVSYNENPF